MRVRRVALLSGAGAVVPVPEDVVDALERVEIVTAVGERGSFQLTFRLDPGSPLPAHFLSESGDLVRIVIVTGEDEYSSVAMHGVVVRHTVSAGGRHRKPALVITGEDLTLLMDLVDTTRTFQSMPLEARVQVILASYGALGFVSSVIPPPVQDVPTAAERVFHQSGTDYAYVRSLADDVGHRFTLDPGPAPGSSVAYWGPEPRGDRSQPALVIDFDDTSNVEGLQISFDATRRVTPEALILEPISKTTIPVPVPSIEALAPPLGAVVPPAHGRRRLRETAKLTAVQAAGALLAHAARSAEAMTGYGTLRVRRHQHRLRAPSIVEIRGTAAPFTGLFAVNRVHDTITALGHRQDFELLRAGIGAQKRSSA